MQFPPFRSRLPWLGADLQTLRNTVRGPAIPLEVGGRLQIRLPMRDGSGDVLIGTLDGELVGADPLVILIHGLGGSDQSEYMRTSSALLRRRGFSVLRLNLRGAGASRPFCRLQYHAGRTGDLADVLATLREVHGVRSFFPIGYSLGGNMLLKFLAEHGPSYPIAGAVSVSAPLDLAAACRRILEPRNRLYHRALLRRMVDEAQEEGSELSERERRALLAVRSILEFDENFVAPRNGYSSAREYYRHNASKYYLRAIAVPTLLIQALDDPWIPADAYRGFDWESNAHLRPLLSEGGGHVGFHGAGTRAPWHDRCVDVYLTGLLGGSAASDERDVLSA